MELKGGRETDDRGGVRSETRLTVYTITEQDGKKYRLTPDNTNKPLKRIFTHHELQRVDSVDSSPSLPRANPRTPRTLRATTAQRKQASQYKRQVRTFQRGHEVQDIDEQGRVTYKPRLQPAETTTETEQTVP